MEAGDEGRDESGTGSGSMKDEESSDQVPAGLNKSGFKDIRPVIKARHTWQASSGQCTSLLSQRIRAPVDVVWSVVRRFDQPQLYKHFIRSCSLKDPGGEIKEGCLRELSVISGLPASTSTERLDLLDDERHVIGFTIIGGEHRLRNYRSVTTVDEVKDGESDEIWTVVLESYVVDVPEGNTKEDTRLFADTVIGLNLQKLASLTEVMAGK